METNRDPKIDAYAAELIRCKACQLVGKAGLTAHDVDDLIQELTAELLKCLPKFDPRKASFKTYVSCVVRRKAYRIIRERIAEMRNPARESHSLNQVDAEESPEAGAHAVTQEEHDRRIGRRNRSVEEQAQLALDVASVLAKLPDRLRRLCEVMKHKLPTEAAQRLSIARSTVYERIGQAREVFERADLRKYL